jgi:putative endonuclease
MRAGNGLIMIYTYVLRSEIDNKLYVGWTEDLNRRIDEHNNGMVDSTRPRRPLKLIYYEACNNKKDAIAREKALKTGFGRAYLKRRISE